MKPHERERYTVERCSLQAKFLFAAPKPPPTRVSPPLASPKGAGTTPASTAAVAVAVGAGAEARTPSTAAAAGATVERDRGCSFTRREEEQGEEGDRGRTRRMEEEGERGKNGGGFDALQQEKEEEQNQRLAMSADGEQKYRVPPAENQSTNMARDISPLGPTGGHDGEKTGDPTQDFRTYTKSRGRKGGRRRKRGGQGGGGCSGEHGGSEGVSEGVGNVFRNGAAEEVPVELSRKQERARSGRR